MVIIFGLDDPKFMDPVSLGIDLARSAPKPPSCTALFHYPATGAMLLAVLGIGGGACALHFLIQWLLCKRMLGSPGPGELQRKKIGQTRFFFSPK